MGRAANDKSGPLGFVIVAMIFDVVNEQRATDKTLNLTNNQFLQLTSVVFPTVGGFQAQHHETRQPN